MEVNTITSGAMDTEHLRQCLAEGKARGKPAIINVNVGTTVKGAVDNVDDVLRVLEELGYVSVNEAEKTSDKLQFYIHVDGALFGLMLPFVGQSDLNAPVVTFKKHIDSISVSGHKFIGAPVPCGVVVTRKKHMEKVTMDIEYLNSRDATIMGSRNGHAALYIWYALSKKGFKGLNKDVELCMRNSKLLRDLLAENGVSCMLNDFSSTVVFERPTDHAFVRKWQLACEGSVAHVVVMPSVGEEKLRTFVAELLESRANMERLATVESTASVATA